MKWKDLYMQILEEGGLLSPSYVRLRERSGGSQSLT